MSTTFRTKYQEQELRKAKSVSFILGQKSNSDSYKRFKDAHGILQPIRAIYKNYNNSQDWMEDLVADIKKYTFPTDLSDAPEEFKNELISEFINRSKIVGYFAARKPKDLVHVTFSVCRPIDQSVFEAWESKYRAMFAIGSSIISYTEKTLNNECVFDEFLPLSFKHRQWLYEDGHMYYFPITIWNQYLHFIDRCKRYYTNDTSNSTPYKKSEPLRARRKR